MEENDNSTSNPKWQNVVDEKETTHEPADSWVESSDGYSSRGSDQESTDCESDSSQESMSEDDYEEKLESQRKRIDQEERDAFQKLWAKIQRINEASFARHRVAIVKALTNRCEELLQSAWYGDRAWRDLTEEFLLLTMKWQRDVALEVLEQSARKNQNATTTVSSDTDDNNGAVKLAPWSKIREWTPDCFLEVCRGPYNWKDIWREIAEPLIRRENDAPQWFRQALELLWSSGSHSSPCCPMMEYSKCYQSLIKLLTKDRGLPEITRTLEQRIDELNPASFEWFDQYEELVRTQEFPFGPQRRLIPDKEMTMLKMFRNSLTMACACSENVSGTSAYKG